MMQLDENFCTGSMDFVYQLFKSGNLTVVPETDFVHNCLTEGVNRSNFNDNQTKTAPGTFDVIVNQLAGNGAIKVSIVCSHRWHNETIFNFEITDFNGGK